MKKLNQIRPPRINKIGPSQPIIAPKKVKMWFKCGTSSMLFTKCKEPTALQLEVKIRKFLSENNIKLEGSFILTQ